jgi:hypothetical protein
VIDQEPVLPDNRRDPPIAIPILVLVEQHANLRFQIYRLRAAGAPDWIANTKNRTRFLMRFPRFFAF